jgi:hypothetical protein
MLFGFNARAEFADDFAVDFHPAGRDQLIAVAARTDPGVRKEFVQAEHGRGIVPAEGYLIGGITMSGAGTTLMSGVSRPCGRTASAGVRGAAGLLGFTAVVGGRTSSAGLGMPNSAGGLLSTGASDCGLRIAAGDDFQSTSVAAFAPGSKGPPDGGTIGDGEKLGGTTTVGNFVGIGSTTRPGEWNGSTTTEPPSWACGNAPGVAPVETYQSAATLGANWVFPGVGVP